MLPSWLVIGGVALLVALVGSAVPAQGARWFKRLRRPRWLTFERFIPFIWTFIFVCGAASAYLVWEQIAFEWKAWLLMSFYLLLELVTVSYMPVMCATRSLRVGAAIGATGVALGIILAFTVLVVPGSVGAFLLLLPYLIWSPIGTFTTWQMMRLNSSEA